MKRLLIVTFLIVWCISCNVTPTPAVNTPGPDLTTSTAVLALTSTPAADLGTSIPGPVPTQDPSHTAYEPNASLTPGDTLDVTKADICVSGYSSKVRNVTDSVKNQVYQEYGITSHAPGAYEVDHLISLELGGSNSIKNLWPQSYSGNWNAHIKDKLENTLHSLVCNGSLDLKTAQQDIATDWIAAYIKYIGQP